MNSWAELGLGELDDFKFGVNRGWVPGEVPGSLERRYETPHFVVYASARMGRRRLRGTKVYFDIDEVLPDMLAAQDYMREKGYPSRSKDKGTYKVWSRALTAQGRRFKQLLAMAKSESPELSTLLDGWGGCAFAHGPQRPMPVLYGVGLWVPAEVGGMVDLLALEGVYVFKRDTYTEELARERFASNAG